MTPVLDHRDSELQEMLRSTARAHAAQYWPLSASTAGRATTAQRKEEISRCTALGWLAMISSERLGGSGISILDAAAFVETLAEEGLIDTPVVAANIAMRLLEESENAELQRAASRLASGEAFFTISTASQQSVARSLKSIDGRASGTLHCVPYADCADGIVLTLDDKIVMLPMTGCRARENPTLGWPESYTVDVIDVPLDERSPGARSVPGLADVLCSAFLSVQMAGLMVRIARMTAAYTSERVVFGKPIARFQAARHRAVELFSIAELTRSTVFQAIYDWEKCGDPRSIWRAKHWSNRAVDRITQSAHLLHGGIGVSAEYPLHLFTTGLMGLAIRGGTIPELNKNLADS